MSLHYKPHTVLSQALLMSVQSKLPVTESWAEPGKATSTALAIIHSSMKAQDEVAIMLQSLVDKRQSLQVPCSQHYSSWRKAYIILVAEWAWLITLCIGMVARLQCVACLIHLGASNKIFTHEHQGVYEVQYLYVIYTPFNSPMESWSVTTLPTYSATYVLRNQAARRSNMATTTSWIIEEWLVQDSQIQLSLLEVPAGSSEKNLAPHGVIQCP